MMIRTLRVRILSHRNMSIGCSVDFCTCDQDFVWLFTTMANMRVHTQQAVLLNEGKIPESGIPPIYGATRWYTKVHLACCLRFSTLISQIGRVPHFGAGPMRYIRSRLFRLTVTAFWRAFTASWRHKGKRKQILPRAVRTTELPSNTSPLTFGNNQIQI